MADRVDDENAQPSEEEVRAYLEQLRNAPVDQVLAEVCSALVSAAQVKLGRSDGRLLIDVVDAVTAQMRGRVDEELLRQLDEALTQLRMAQVDAERHAGDTPESGDASAADQAASDPQPSPGPSSDDQGAGGSAKRLWTPGA